MLYGYTGKIIRVNLDSQSVQFEEFPEKVYKHYIGGRGLAARILYDDLPKDLNPLDPRNEVIFMTGPYTGVPAPASARFEIATLSPQTGFFGAANAGGFFGPALKRAGFDGVIIQGVSSNPVYLWLNNGEAELRDAEKLWGQDTYITEDLIREELDNNRIRVACIGPAGENAVNFAAVMCDRGRAAARSGAAPLLGLKKMKAIACYGKKRVELAHKEKFKEVASYFNRKILKDPIFKMLKLYGSDMMLSLQYIFGDVPVKNWSQSSFQGIEKLSGNAMFKTILVRDKACLGCAISCKRHVRIDTGKYKLEENPASGPEYETIAALGTLCMVDNLKAVAKANDLCNRYGLDTISTGSVIAFAMECYEKGLITQDELDGINLQWGDADALIKCIKLIVTKEKLGALLARGSKQASKEIEGSENFSVTVKGLEVAMHDPRSSQILGLHYATTPFGGRHSSATEAIAAGLASLPSPDLDFLADPDDRALDRFSPVGKAAPLITMQDRNMLFDCAGQCAWLVSMPGIPTHYLSAFLALITGWKMSYRKIFLKTGERISNLIHAFNIKQGFTMKDCELPYRFLREPPPDGGSKGAVVHIQPMLREYFKLRDWDWDTGKPSREKLLELELDDIAADLWP